MRSWIVITTVCLLAGCDGGSGGADAGTDGGTTSGTLIRAAEGGEVVSGDGIFTLYVPPGALAEDTTISIAIAPREEWPAEIPEAARLGELYDIQPDGTTFDPPAIAIWRWSVAPPGTRDPAPRFLGVASRDGAGTISLDADAHVLYREDGSMIAGAEVDHLSEWCLWIPNIGVVNAHHGFAPSRARGEIWASEEVRLTLGPPRGMAVNWEVVLTAMSTAGSAASALEFMGGTSAEWSSFDQLVSGIDTAPGSSVSAGIVEVPVGPDVERIVEPLPQWRCSSAGGPGHILFRIGLRLVGSTALGRGPTFTSEETGLCRGVPAPGARTANVLLGDVCRARRSGDVLSCDATRSTSANVIQPTAALEASFSTTSGESSIFEGVTSWGSVVGPPTITLESSLQSATATHDGTRYAITGLTAGGAFAETDTFTVTGTPPGATAPTVVSIDAPAALSSPSDVLGAPDGLTTEMHFTDGAFDAMYVYAIAIGSATSGEAGVIRVVPASAMTLAGSVRTAPLFDAATIAELESRGLTITQISVGPIRETVDTALFPGLSTPIQAARFVQVALADITPLPPGGAIVRDCSALPATFTPHPDERVVGDRRIAVVCIDDADAFCRITNDPYQDEPLLPAQCADPDIALHLFPNRTTGEPMACNANIGWRPVWSSRGYYASSGCMYEGGAVGVEQFFEVERIADGTRRRVRFQSTGPGTVEVLAVESDPSGPYPPYGAQHSCRQSPVTLPAPTDTTNPHARVFLDNSGTCVPCMIYGDSAASPEVETVCSNVAELELRYSATSDLRVARFSTAGGSTGWSIESASAGTIVPPRRVESYPVDTDVTVVVTNGTQRWQIVFRHTSANEYVVSSVARL